MNQADWKMLGIIALASGFVINIFGLMIAENWTFGPYLLYGWLMFTLGIVLVISGLMFSWRARQIG